MPHAPPVAVLIPAFDEEESLPGVLDAWRAQDIPLHLVVVDNGSTDHTAQRAAQRGATVVYEPDQGYGQACLAGLRYLQQRGVPPEIVVISDADGADDPADLRALLTPLTEGEADLVIGSRTLGQADDGALSPQARAGNTVALTLMSQLHGRRFSDLGPFRAIRFDALCALEMEDTTWGWNVEMQLKALRRGLRVVEVPVHYRRRVAGASKISGSFTGAIRAGFKMLWAVYRYG